MAQKTVKKTPAKKVAAVKTTSVKKTATTKAAPAKKPVAKKTVAKKTTVKKVATPELKPVIVAPEMHDCGCGKDCKCGHGCPCGCRAARFVKKLIVILIVFALGFVAAKMCCGGPRVHFQNGCLDVASVKCPKMQAALPMMDMDGDGCITKFEFKAFKKQMRRAAVEQEVHAEIAE